MHQNKIALLFLQYHKIFSEMECASSEYYHWNPANHFHFEDVTKMIDCDNGTYGVNLDIFCALEIVFLKTEVLYKEAILA